MPDTPQNIGLVEFTRFRFSEINVGDVFYYLDGVLRGAEPLGVATTAVLIPYWWAGTADDATGTVNKVNVDYIEFWSPRPTS